MTAPSSEKQKCELDVQKSLIKKPLFKVIPSLLDEEDILNIFKKSKIDKDIKNILVNVFNSIDIKITKIKNELREKIGKKRIKIINKKRIRVKIFDIPKQKKDAGRKSKEDLSMRFHNKYGSDNIMSKLRNKFHKCLNKFINKIIDSLYTVTELNNILNLEIKDGNEKKKLIKDIDYKTISFKIRKEKNLELLKYTIKEFINLKMSCGKNNCNLYEKYNNKIIIQKLLNDENNKDIFNFLFNELTILDCLNIFTYKKEFNDFFQFNLLNKYKKNIIKDCLVRFDKIIISMYNNKEELVYLHCFILLAYNFKRYYSIKYERRPKTKKNKNIN